MSKLSLRCAEFHGNIAEGLISMLETEQYANVTIAVEGKYLKAHQMVLSICSPYFNTLLQSNPCKHPIIFIKNVKYNIMKHLLRFMYEGQTQIEAVDFPILIETAQELQIKWLSKWKKQKEDAKGTASNSGAIKRSLRLCTQEKPPTQANIVKGPMKQPTSSLVEPVTKRPKILIEKEKPETETAATGSNDTQLDIKVEEANDSYQDAERLFVEPIDNVRDSKEMDFNLNVDVKEEKQEIEYEDDQDVIDYDNNEDDELLPTMEQVPGTSLPVSTAQEGQPVTVSYCEARNGVNVIIDNYSYHKRFVGKSWISWGCTHRCTRSCNASVQLTSDNRVIFKNKHSHMPERNLYLEKILNEETYYSAKSVRNTQWEILIKDV